MDWHAAVYGSRSGTGGYRDFGGRSGDSCDDDDFGRTYGAYGRTQLVDDDVLKRRSGSAYYRAHDVLSSGRMHDCTYAVTDAGVSLGALVTSADQYADDYRVSVEVDEDAGDIADSSCTCPAYGRFRGVCKHVVALIMDYDERPDDFQRVASGASGAGRAPSRQSARRTSRALAAFMQRREADLRQQEKDRQLGLLKEIGSIADAGGTAGGAAGGMQAVRHMPIGSVTLRPTVECRDTGCFVRLRIQVPSRSIAYVVKDIHALLQAVRHQEFVSYGKKLAFIHTRDAFDPRSRALIGVLDRADAIHSSINDDYADSYLYRRKADAAEMRLSDNEIADLLDVYVGSDATVDYAPSSRYYAQTAPSRVVEGDPALGLAMEPAGGESGDDGEPSGYVISHAQCVERFIVGQRSSYVIVRPMSPAVLEAGRRDRSGAAGAAGAAGSASHGNIVPNDGKAEDAWDMLMRVRSQAAANTAPAVIRRCGAGFAANRELITLLSGDDEHASMFLSAADVDAFARTILPLLDDGGAAPESGGDPSRGGLGIVLPERLRRLVQAPCRIEIYLDRDREGVSCDVQARYGDARFHVFDGIGSDAANGGVRRDAGAERLAVEAVLHYFPRPSSETARIPESDDEAIYRLLTEGLPVFRGIGDVFSTPAFDGLSAMPKPTIRVGLSVRSGLVEISPIADEIDPADVAALLASYRKRRRFHRLRNGSFVDLRTVDATAVDDIANDLGLRANAFESGPVTVPAFEAYYLDHQVGAADKDASFTGYLDDLRVIDPARYRVPGALAGVLRPYQAEGFRWLNAVSDKGFGGILADEMGLGKTVQLLSYLLSRRDEARRVGPSLIVCPASLVYNWAAEAAKFTPELTVAVVAGSKASRRAILDGARRACVDGSGDGSGDGSASPGSETDDGWQGASTASVEDRDPVPDILVTSYDLLRRDIADYEGVTCYCMALDEAQYIKNAATKSAKAVRAVNARHRFALTGTPIENRLSELWSIFDFLMPGILGSYTHFRERFEMPVLSGDEAAQAKLQAFVGPFILRRLKSQVLKDLPDKIENVITVQLEGEQRKLYAALEQQLRATLNKTKDVDFNTGKIQVLAQLMRLRQVCCDPRLLYENAGEAGGSAAARGGAGDGVAAHAGRDAAGRGVGKPGVAKMPSAKLDAIAELVDSCRDAGRKMLIFSQFTSYLDLIAERLRANGVAYDMITGTTPKKRRLELVDRFNADATPVFLISLKAGNTGLNLTGACVVVHADPWWNAAAQDQATDRAHRIGQTQDVNVYQIVAKDTIEERILNLQRTKTDLATRFVDAASSSTGHSIASLTKEDLLSLLG
ncbi:DEAD/DEAH box helicase [Bifidobacterium scardovii]|uniref:DEAD/DEAH box helicase n=1 Tax=Bifidobacterium scardovii TaxID=158787 RepID=UPI0025506A77|nr:DEAD/DEAH box helicase [Bifidobacterium scardovii]MDK6348525.1 DEAD/DEAH box helicase [Bifidobacterium scardovii]